LRKVLIEKLEVNAEPIADALIAKGLEGDVPALRELLDRGLGKPVQGIDHTTNGESLNEKITKLDDGQLDQPIASGHAGKPLAPEAPGEGVPGGAAAGEAEAAQGEPS